MAEGAGGELASGILGLEGGFNTAGVGSAEAMGLGQGYVTPAKGLLTSGLEWAQKNPVLAMTAGQTVAGAVQGAGAGIGAQQAAKIQAQGAKDRIEQEAAQKLATSREGTYAGGIGVAPAANSILYTKDGKPVYVPGAVGIINQPGRA